MQEARLINVKADNFLGIDWDRFEKQTESIIAAYAENEYELYREESHSLAFFGEGRFSGLVEAIKNEN